MTKNTHKLTPAKLQKLITRIWRLKGTLAEIGREFGVTREYVRRLAVKGGCTWYTTKAKAKRPKPVEKEQPDPKAPVRSALEKAQRYIDRVPCKASERMWDFVNTLLPGRKRAYVTVSEWLGGRTVPKDPNVRKRLLAWVAKHRK